jgi:hypothetical protein
MSKPGFSPADASTSHVYVRTHNVSIPAIDIIELERVSNARKTLSKKQSMSFLFHRSVCTCRQV